MSSSLRIALTLVPPLGVIACQPATTTVAVDLPSKIDFSDGFQQSDADAIIRKCGADDVEIKVASGGEITFVPGANADYDASVCVLKYIKESGTTKFGFVGNEKYAAPEESQ